MKRAAFSIVALTGAALAACGDDLTSLPQPQPIPGLVRRSTPGLTAADPETLVLGLSGAVSGIGVLELRRARDGLQVTAPSSSAGSFSLVIAAAQGDELELRYRNDQGVSEPLVIFPALTTRGPFLGAPPSFGVPVSAPDAAGNVTVTNDSGEATPLFIASPESEVLVSNEGNAAVASGTTDGAGLFSLALPASSGETIRVLVAVPTDPGATSDFLTFEVP